MGVDKVIYTYEIKNNTVFIFINKSKVPSIIQSTDASGALFPDYLSAEAWAIAYVNNAQSPTRESKLAFKQAELSRLSEYASNFNGNPPSALAFQIQKLQSEIDSLAE